MVACLVAGDILLQIRDEKKAARKAAEPGQDPEQTIELLREEIKQYREARLMDLPPGLHIGKGSRLMKRYGKRRKGQQ
jgi:hypothetical protein